MELDNGGKAGTKVRKLVVLCALALGLVGITNGVAGADPSNAKNALFVTATCANGQSFQIVTNGNGAFTAAHDRNSTATLIPFAFGEFTATVTDPAGNVVDTFTDPPITKRSAANHSLLECPFTFSQTFPDGFTFAGSGTAFVKL
jgi:hypothetical protein